MYFIIQKEKNTNMDLEAFIVQDILNRNKWTDEYNYYCLNDFAQGERNLSYPAYIKNGIPIGSIEFVESWMKQLHQIEKINPIEVPICLRKDEFLKRDYKILKKADLPLSGKIFFKDVSQLKQYSGVVDCEYFFSDEMWNKSVKNFDTSLRLDATHLYQVSEVIPILSEYRVYVQDDKVEAIANYNGDPCLLPDIKLLLKMVNIYSMEKDRPKAYTIDLAVNQSGTLILEIHPWISVGLYNSLWSRNLLYAYRDGIDYVLDYNTEITEWK